jgi:RNA polymerase sigma-70 factor, ECF subfamily
MEKRTQEQRFLEAYDQFADGIFRFVYFKTSNREQALDITQDVFTKAWDKIVQGEEVREFKAFLYKIAHNAVIDYYRKRKNVSLDQMIIEQNYDVEYQGHVKAHASAESRLVLDHVSQLEPKYREVVTMRYVHDLSPREIAAIIGETENVVSVRLNRALKALRTHLRIS